MDNFSNRIISSSETVRAIVEGEVVRQDTHCAYNKDTEQYTACVSGFLTWSAIIRNTSKHAYVGMVYLILNGTNEVRHHTVEIAVNKDKRVTLKYPCNAGDTFKFYVAPRLVLFRSEIEISQHKSCDSGIVKGDEIKYDYGTYIREGEYMVVYSNVTDFSLEHLPKGYLYETLFFERLRTWVYKVKVKGWTHKLGLSFTVPEQDTHTVQSTYLVDVPGTYMVGEQKITLNSGSMFIHVDQKVKQGDVVTIPFKKV